MRTGQRRILHFALETITNRSELIILIRLFVEIGTRLVEDQIVEFEANEHNYSGLILFVMTLID